MKNAEGRNRDVMAPSEHRLVSGEPCGTFCGDWPNRVLRTVYVQRVVEPEGVIKCITVIHLICASIGSSYRNARFGIEILVVRACLETTRGAVFGEKAGWRDEGGAARGHHRATPKAFASRAKPDGLFPSAASSSPSSPREERVGRGPRRGETNKHAPPLPSPLLHPMEEREKSRSLMQALVSGKSMPPAVS